MQDFAIARANAIIRKNDSCFRSSQQSRSKIENWPLPDSSKRPWTQPMAYTVISHLLNGTWATDRV